MRIPALSLAFVLAATASVLSAQTPQWNGSWATSVYVPETANQLAPADLTDATLRQTVHLSAGGSSLRVHLSNAFGTSALYLSSVHIARPKNAAAAAIDPATDRTLTFSGAPDVLIPAGAEWISDPIAFNAPALSDVTVSIHFVQPPSRQTGHPGSRATVFYAHGDLTAAADMPSAQKAEHWYTLSAIDVASPGFSVVAFGDSITDGHAATIDHNERWPDVLAQHLQTSPATRDVGVLNQGIGGNHMLTDGLGPSALSRLDRDLLAQTSVRYAVLLEGINDIGALSRSLPDATPEQHHALVHGIIASYEQFLAAAHAHHIRVIGATITAFTGSGYYHPTAANEADRQAVNAWIRTPGHFDGVVDFDKITADPADPTRLLPAYDSGDHLHPSPAGYRAMGSAIPLTMFQ